MEQAVVASFAKDLKFEGFLLVRSSDQRTGSNGRANHTGYVRSHGVHEQEVLPVVFQTDIV